MKEYNYQPQLPPSFISQRAIVRLQDRLSGCLERGEFASAVGHAKEILALDEGHLWAQWCLIRAYSSQGELLKAMEACEKALELYPMSALLLQALGRTYLFSTDDSDEIVAGALDAFQRAVRLSSGNQSCYRDLGQTYLVMGEFTRASSAFQRSMAFDRESRDGYLMACKGLALVGMMKEEEALDLTNEALERTPECPSTLRTAGVVFVLSGHLLEGEECFRSAARLAKKHLDISVELEAVERERSRKSGQRLHFKKYEPPSRRMNPLRLSKRLVLGSAPWL